MSASHGHDASFDEFYRQHRADAVRWAAALVGRRDVAEDLAQDALLRTGARLDTLDNPTGYLRRAVVNGCHSWHRSTARETRRVDLVVAGQPTAVAAQDLSGPTVEVLDALAGLGYQQRAAVVLRFWADWADDDIAQALDTTTGNVRVMVHRGLAHLRTRLAPTASTTDGSAS